MNTSTLKEFLLKNVITSKTSIDDNEPLFSSGLIDSFGTLDLLFFIKETTQISVEDYEIADNGIDSINDLVNFINSKK